MVLLTTEPASRVRTAHLVRVGPKNGYILLPVVLFITLIATIAFLLNNDNTLNVDMTGAAIEAEKVQQMTQAGLAHATWGAQNSGCVGDMSMTTVPFGQGSYTATVDAGGPTITNYTFTPDRDTWIKEASPDENNAGASLLSVKIKSGDSFRTLYHFDLATIPSNEKVVTATAWFYVNQNDAQGSVTLHPVTTDWTETGATWNTMGSNFESGVYGTIPPQPVMDVWVSVNLTALAQAWVNNPGTNYGILLNATLSDLESRFTSRESAASQRPYLQITTADGDVSPVQISATGTLAPDAQGNSITRIMSRTNLPAYQPSAADAVLASADTYLNDGPQAGSNYGDRSTIIVTNHSTENHGVLRFNLSTIPSDAFVTSAVLEMNLSTIGSANSGMAYTHRVTQPWSEMGATWDEYQAGQSWAAAGGDFDPVPVAEAFIDNASPGPVEWYIKDLVAGWVDGSYPNDGLLLTVSTGINNANFYSRDSADSTTHPKLTITYACECGTPCIAPQASGNVLLLISGGTPSSTEASRKALFESWGYTVDTLDMNAGQTTYDNKVGNNDVVYIPESVDPATVGNKLTGAPVGVVNEEGALNSALGISNFAGYAVGSSINVTDTTHYITALFPAGPLDIYSADMEQQGVFNGPAPGLQTLADIFGNPSLAVLEIGAALKGGGTAAGRRVALPLGREGSVNWDYLNSNSRLVLQRALQWGIGATSPSPAPTQNLLFVSGGTVLVQFPSGDLVVIPTSQEQLRIDLIESWGYSVNLIADDDTQANIDTAVAANDVAYVSSETDSAALGAKLLNVTIGVVNESMPLAETFGFDQGYSVKSRDQVRVLDNTHHITSPLATGYIPIFTSLQTVYLANHGTTQDGDARILADVFNTGSDSQNKASLMTLSPGDAFETGGGTAAGRRVQLPWGDSTFDVAALNTDGQTIMRRAIEWAATPPPPSCNADYIPDNKVSEFGPVSNIHGLSYFPGGMTFNGAAASADGAWLSIDQDGLIRMSDLAGNVLTSCSIAMGATEKTEGITFVESGTYADHLAVAIDKTGDSAIVYVQLDCTILTTLPLTAIYNASGIAYIGTTASGTYDDYLAVADFGADDEVYIVDQAGVQATVINVTSIVDNLKSIGHLPGTDRLLLPNASAGQMGAIIDFVNYTGALNTYDVASLGADTPEGAAINPLTCRNTA